MDSEKQEYERIQIYQQLEESKKKLACAQANLQKVLENEKNHNLNNSAKVGFGLWLCILYCKYY